MLPSDPKDHENCHPETSTGDCTGGRKATPSPVPDSEISCCGSAIAVDNHPHDRPGYTLCGFVKAFVDTAVGSVPVVKTGLERRDRLGAMAVRSGINRGGYRIAPGLYAVGSPDTQAPVLVTANYKLSFDALRKELGGLDLWILCLETHGVNVWCAAGKGTFATAEVVRRVASAGLETLLDHRRLILPQLSATGVSARGVKRGCGFKVVWGPIRAADIRAFLDNDLTADATMRRVTFTLRERLVLAPVEIANLAKPALILLLAVLLLSGFGPGIFSLDAAWLRGGVLAAACILGALAGALGVPALLPWLPGKAFALKGLVAGVAVGLATVVLQRPHLNAWGALALLLGAGAISSFVAMNFTGSSPYTSPSGVEKEMRRAIPLQIAAALLAVITWVGAAFAG